jgi:Fe-S-cluster containining protein
LVGQAVSRRRSERRAAVDAALNELYDRVPVINCKGSCRTTCTVIEMSDRERARIADHGVTIPPLTAPAGRIDPKPCAALGPLGQCMVYEVRPMICRIWGVTEDLPCPYGCVPTGDYLTTAEAFELLGEANQVGGPPAGLQGITADVIRAYLDDPDIAAALRRILVCGSAGDRRRVER